MFCIKQAECCSQPPSISNELKAKALLYANPDLIIRIDIKGVLLEIIEPKGWIPFDIKKLRQSRSIQEFMPQETAEEILTAAHKAIHSNQIETFEYDILVGDAQRSRECRVVRLNDAEVMIIIRDITERKNMESILRHIVEGVSHATGMEFFTSLAKYIASYFHVQAVIVGEYEVATKNLRVLAQVQEDELFSENCCFSIMDCVLGDVVKGRDILIKEINSEEYPLDPYLRQLSGGCFVGIPLCDSCQQVIGMIAIFDSKPLEHPDFVANLIKIFALRAASELERLKTEKSNQAKWLLDELTQLPNKRALLTDMAGLLVSPSAQAGITSCLFINLDRFRLINDVLGHEKGDALIQVLACRLSHLTDRHGGLIARFGSDEFVFILTGKASRAEIEDYAVRLLQVIREPILMDGEEYSVSGSVGISIYPQDGETSQQLLQNADVAMHLAKNSGRNTYQFYHDTLHQVVSHKLGLENRLRQALQENQFMLQYQPQVSIDTGTIVGMEALVRWQSPDYGLISPAEFIPLAEETGLIVPLGKWILYEACRQNRIWQDAGYDKLPVAVNISPIQFRDPNFINTVRDTLFLTGLEGRWLEIEFTEGLTMDKSELVLSHMKALHNMGVAMSIDDFGTGYSSLSYLKSFPIQSLKIDRSFVEGMTLDQSDAAIINAIIAMGKSLNLSLVAEGIETEEQLDLLRGQQCQKAQGFLFSKPLSPRDFEKFILQGLSQ